MSHAIDASVVAAMLFNKNSLVGSLTINGLPRVITILNSDPNLPCGYMIALLEREDTCGLGGTMDPLVQGEHTLLNTQPE